MLGGEYPRDLADRGADRLACLNQGKEAPAGRHPAHRHQVIAYPASRVEYLHDAQVHIGGEPPVELGLALARCRASFRRAEVQEAEVDRLSSASTRGLQVGDEPARRPRAEGGYR